MVLTLGYIKEKWQHAGFQKYLRNTGWMFLGKVASLVIAFIATSYIARSLGPTNYGQLSYAISYVGLFGFFASLGLDQIVYRDIIRFPDKKDTYIGTSFILKIFAGVLTIFITVLSASFLSDQDVSIFLIFIISLSFLFNPFQLLNYEFQAKAHSKFPSLISLTVVLILNILKILIIFNDRGIIYLALVILLEPILMGIGLLYFRIKKYGVFSKPFFSKETARALLKDSFPLVFATAFFGIYARIDQVMIKNILDAESVGLYDAAVRVSELWYFIPNMIVVSLFPAIINAKKHSDIQYHIRIKRLFLGVTSISILTAIITMFLSKYFILIIFGAGFIGATSILNIYIWSNVGATLNYLSQQLLIAENLSSKISIMVFFGMLINIVLNLWLIPIHGTIGAAYATLISYVAPSLLLFIFCDTRKLAFKIMKHNNYL